MIRAGNQSHASDIVEHLASIGGEQVTSAGIGKKFGIGPSASRHMLDALADQGLIRVVSGRQRYYYVPTKEMLAVEEKLATPKVVKPLKLDPYRTELYARIAKDRIDMPTKHGSAK